MCDSASIVRIAKLGFGYGVEPVIRGLDLDVRRGEFLGVLGPNGSGKTTLLKLAAGILRPGEGTIEIDGREIDRIGARDRARRIAIMSQDLSEEFPYTVLEVVLMGRFPHCSAVSLDSEEDVAIAREALGFADALRFESRYIFELSAGERQRVYLARALAQKPRLLLLDEPAAFLDLSHQVMLYDLLRQLNRERGVTIVGVSHDLNLPARYCDRLVLLKSGSVMYIGRPEEVLVRERIENVYGGRVVVGRDPVTQSPYVLPLGRNEQPGTIRES